ncbi:nucleotidyltransferase domain-containing protein [Microbacterium sp.]|jgi:predicted nucleotidyltransferase|uniref:nucleotidyltransferase domain-containing protein n=1 Tax=Microbacterium sp. TaxID=51671 RepID=UPI0026017FA3|nr:nucleotidyltransferase domain-containing protein [uncultured Microbacterium sp.]
MSIGGGVLEGIRAQSVEADALQRRARDLLLDAVHRAAAEGLSQREIAQVVRRSQPEVSRLLRQKPPGPLALRVWDERRAMSTALARYGITNARIFGSVATRSEREGSDLDVLVDTPQVLSLGTLSRLEQELSAMVHASVDVVPVRSLPEHLRDRVLAEAVPL